MLFSNLKIPSKTNSIQEINHFFPVIFLILGEHKCILKNDLVKFGNHSTLLRKLTITLLLICWPAWFWWQMEAYSFQMFYSLPAALEILFVCQNLQSRGAEWLKLKNANNSAFFCNDSTVDFRCRTIRKMSAELCKCNSAVIFKSFCSNSFYTKSKNKD